MIFVVVVFVRVKTVPGQLLFALSVPIRLVMYMYEYVWSCVSVAPRVDRDGNSPTSAFVNTHKSILSEP